MITLKKICLLLLATICCVGVSAQSKTNKKLVVYFSCTGTTKATATELAKVIGADLFEIKPTKLYTSADLNWRDKSSRSSVEMKDLSSRPTISNKITDIKKYDTVFIGFPIWWDLAPTIINTFIESYDFSGITVIPFATSGGSTINNSEKSLHATYPKIKFATGKLLNGSVTDKTISGWIK